MSEEFSTSKDPRIRKRQLSENMEKERSQSRETSSSDIYPPGEGPVSTTTDKGTKKSKKASRSKSRSRSPEGRARKRHYDNVDKNRRSSAAAADENWKKSTDKFLHNLGAAGAMPPQQMTMAPTAYPGYGYPPPAMHYAYPGGAPPGYPPMGMPTNYPPMAASVPPPLMPEHRRHNRSPDMIGDKREKQRKRNNNDDNDDSSDSDNKGKDDDDDGDGDDKGRKKSAGITVEQRDKLLQQQTQYVDAKKKLETQLLKLKEQREVLKEGGAVHEDKIMKENAKLQKEVKSRIHYINDVLSKMDIALQQPVVEMPPPATTTVPAVRDKSPSPTEVRRVRRTSEMDDDSGSRSRTRKSSSRERSEEKERSKKKKKKKTKDRSSSEDESDRSRDKEKKKKKKKKKAKSSSESDSESDQEEKNKANSDKNVIHMDETVFRMVADLKGGHSTGGSKSGKKSDEMLMDLLGKMSEAYMNSKKENKELLHRIQALESDNKLLKHQLEQEIGNNKRKIKVVEQEEEVRTVTARTSSPELKEREKSVRAKMAEKDRKRRSRSTSSSSEGSPIRSSKRSSSRYEKERKRDKEREERREVEREREERREMEREKARLQKERNDRINLDEWTPKQSDHVVKIDPTLAGIKEKLKQKQEEEMVRKRRADEEEKRKQWAAVPAPEVVPKLSREERHPVEVARPQVAIQWGSQQQQQQQQQHRSKSKTPEPQANKKTTAVPFVGKMPWLSNKKDSRPENGNETAAEKPSRSRSRFGPPTTNIAMIPPPTLMTTVPPPNTVSEEDSNNPPLPVAPLPPGQATYSSAAVISLPGAPPLPRKPPPKNPTPQNVNISDMLAAAKAHMMARGEVVPPPVQRVEMDMEIPLPPLPAAQDKDPEAMHDTRPPKIPTPPPPKKKTELEMMLEKHEGKGNVPPGFSGDDNVVTVHLPPQPAPPAYDMTLYAAYAAHWGPGFDRNAASIAAQLPTQAPEQEPEHSTEATLAAVAEAVPNIDTAVETINEVEAAKAEAMEADDPSDLAMLGIDPDDLAGFGR